MYAYVCPVVEVAAPVGGISLRLYEPNLLVMNVVYVCMIRLFVAARFLREHIDKPCLGPCTLYYQLVANVITKLSI